MDHSDYVVITSQYKRLDYLHYEDITRFRCYAFIIIFSTPYRAFEIKF